MSTPVTSRYFQLLNHAPQSGAGGYYSIGDIEVREYSGSPNLCSGGTAFGNSNYYPPERAFDGEITVAGNKWWTGNPGDGRTIGYDFGVPRTFSEITIRNRDYSDSAQTIKVFDIQISGDGVAWTTVLVVTDHPGTPSLDTTYAVENPPEPTTRALINLLGRQNNEVPNALLSRTGVYDRAAVLGTNNIYHGGSGRVAGTVKYKPNSPVHRKVRLVDEKTGVLVREMWSTPITGAYSFDYVDETRKYTVLSYDYTGAYRAVIADNLAPELIP